MRPNFILIHGHDLGRWLSCYERPEIPTPNIDRLAQESLVFEQAFSSAPLCTPARGAMLTGLSPHANGLVGLAHDSWTYFDDVQTLPELLAPLGYSSTLVGLQHEQNDPRVLGYDQVLGVGFLPRALVVAEAACEWLKRYDNSHPFFLNVGMWEAHRPWPIEDYTPVDPAQVHVPSYLPDNEMTRADIAAMYSAIAQFDRAVGSVLESLHITGLSSTTLLVLTTDHGVPFPRAKGTLYDSGTGVAFVVRPPTEWNVTPCRIRQQISHLDLVPTFLELAGDSALPVHEGHSLAPTILRATEPFVYPIFSEKTYHDTYDPIRAVRTEDRKYIRNFTAGPKLSLAKDLEASATRQGMGNAHLSPRPFEEFYLLDVDPDELNNVIHDEALADEIDEFRAMLQNWMERTGDPLLYGEIQPAEPPTRVTRARPL